MVPPARSKGFIRCHLCIVWLGDTAKMTFLKHRKLALNAVLRFSLFKRCSIRAFSHELATVRKLVYSASVWSSKAFPGQRTCDDAWTAHKKSNFRKNKYSSKPHARRKTKTRHKKYFIESLCKLRFNDFAKLNCCEVGWKFAWQHPLTGHCYYSYEYIFICFEMVYCKVRLT